MQINAQMINTQKKPYYQGGLPYAESEDSWKSVAVFCISSHSQFKDQKATQHNSMAKQAYVIILNTISKRQDGSVFIQEYTYEVIETL